jgi:hypothetical protein
MIRILNSIDRNIDSYFSIDSLNNQLKINDSILKKSKKKNFSYDNLFSPDVSQVSNLTGLTFED